MKTFWETLGYYNSVTAAYQIALIVLGMLVTAFVLFRPCRRTDVAAKVYLIVLYLWIAVAYYHVCCAEREYNNVMSIYWGIMAAAWLWDLLRGYTELECSPRNRVFAIVMMLMPFVYPCISLLRGLRFPYLSSPVMPSAVATYTIGLLLLSHRKVNIFIVLLLCHWSLIGLSKTYCYHIPEDFILAFATVPAIYFFFREHFLVSLTAQTKPSALVINRFLIGFCMALALLLCFALYMVFA
jgi:hypothetical protein